ncbi:MAG: NADH:flavin oxidoreductase [Desulfobacterales bacterium]|nr:NADH:flavin oxidoreductase [Desulfobacterales bacterium]
MTAVDHLFTPLKIGGLSLANRVVMAPMTREFSPNGIPGPDVADYYSRRAAGGVGLIVTEGCAINRTGALGDNIPHLFGEKAAAAWRVVVDGVHQAGGKIFPQMWHVGFENPKTSSNPNVSRPNIKRLGPSGITVDGEQIGEPMTGAEIEQTIADYASAAKFALDAGFDGVAIHGAHGYLLDQFFWTRTNRRTDRYGGDVKARSRFAAEVVRECRRQVGSDFPILLRFSQWKSADYNARIAQTPQELEALLAPLAEAGVDVFEASTRRFWEPAFQGSPLGLAAWAKKVTGKTAMAVGSVTLASEFKSDIEQGKGGMAESLVSVKELEALAEMLAREEFDLVAIGRAMIANPDWATRVKSGRAAELKPFRKDALASLY